MKVLLLFTAITVLTRIIDVKYPSIKLDAVNKNGHNRKKPLKELKNDAESTMTHKLGMLHQVFTS